MAVKKKLVNGKMVKVGLYGKIRVASTHPTLGYEVIFHCEPYNDDNTVCDTCKFRFKCFTDEEIQVVFRGRTLGIFPAWWKQPEPSAIELEQYLFNKEVNLLQVRTIPSMQSRKFYGKEK